MAIDVSYKYAANDMACSKITFDSDYMVMKADQRAYQFIYEEYARFDKLIADEDVDKFYRFINDEEASDDKFIIVRVRRKDGDYRLCLIYVLKRKIPINDTYYTEIELRDLVTLNNRYKKMDLDVRKYRSYLGMIPEYFFEYNPSTQEFALFSYKGFRSENIEKAPIDEVYNNAVKNGYVTGENISKLQLLFEKIRNCEESFTVELETSICRKGEMSEELSFHGQVMYHNNELARVIGIASMVSRIGKATSGAAYGADAAEKDSATGLLNKRAMTEFVKNKIRYYNETGKKEEFWLVICDIDYFKNVNDTYGHLFGDEVIYRFAQTIRTWVSDKGVVGRIGGDEFMIMLEHTDLTELRSILIGIREELEWAFQNKAQDYRFTTSIGVAKYPKDAEDYERLFKIADKALYIAKEKGRDRFIIYTKELHGELADEQDGVYTAHVPVEMKPLAKAELAANLILLLSKAGRQMIPHVLNEIIEHLNIHGISIFERNSEDKLELSLSAGKYESEIGDVSEIMDDKYFNLFDENGINLIHNVKEFEIHCPRMYDYWVEHGICSTLQFMMGTKEHADAVISFDIFGVHRRKWSENDIDTLYMIVKFIGNTLES